MTIDDYEAVFSLWQRISGLGIRKIDDSYDSIHRFLKRNPNISVVAEKNGKLVGSILAGHDGRRANLYHVCVEDEFRRQGIGEAMVEQTLNAIKKENLTVVHLVAYTRNDIGNQFWQKIGWAKRDDLYYYDYPLKGNNNPRVKLDE